MPPRQAIRRLGRFATPGSSWHPLDQCWMTISWRRPWTLPRSHLRPPMNTPLSESVLDLNSLQKISKASSKAISRRCCLTLSSSSLYTSCWDLVNELKDGFRLTVTGYMLPLPPIVASEGLVDRDPLLKSATILLVTVTGWKYIHKILTAWGQIR